MKIGRPKVWTDENIERAKRLWKTHTSREVGLMFAKSKNAILGALYRNKVKNGYVPPLYSKYAKPNGKKYTFRHAHNYGERKCNICEKVFIKNFKFAVFCDNCRKNIS
tara:strand:- start:285 stop:608 length:324 start_codon:yes stop_codon:yes gene_type:complete